MHISYVQPQNAHVIAHKFAPNPAMRCINLWLPRQKLCQPLSFLPLLTTVRGISMPSGIGDEANLHIDYLPEVIIKQHQRTPQGHGIKVFLGGLSPESEVKLTHNLFTKHVWHGQKLDHFSPTNWKFRLRIERDKAKQLICFSARRQLCTVHPTSTHTHTDTHHTTRKTYMSRVRDAAGVARGLSRPDH